MESLTAEKVAYCAAALKTADIIFEIVGEFKPNLFWEDHRNKDAAFLYNNQTAKGLLLEFWGSRPVIIVTPWGRYCFAGWCHFAGCEESEREIWKKIMPRLKTSLGLGLYKPKSEIKVDTIHGDLWAIGVQPCDEFSLPFPEERGYSAFISDDMARAEWSELVELVKKPS